MTKSNEKGPRGVIKEIVRHSMAFADENPIFQSDGENSVVLAVKACRARLGLASRDRVATLKQANGGAERSVRELRTGGMTLLTCLEEKLEAKIDHSHVLAAWAIQHWAWLRNRYHVSLIEEPRMKQFMKNHMVTLLHTVWRSKTLTDPEKGKLVPWQKVWVGKSTVSNKHIVLSAIGASDARTIRKLGEPWQKACVFSARGTPWDYAKGATGVSLRNGDRERAPGVIAGLPDDEAAAIVLKPAVDEMAKRGEEPREHSTCRALGSLRHQRQAWDRTSQLRRVWEPLPGTKSSESGVAPASSRTPASPSKREAAHFYKRKRGKQLCDQRCGRKSCAF